MTHTATTAKFSHMTSTGNANKKNQLEAVVLGALGESEKNSEIA